MDPNAALQAVRDAIRAYAVAAPASNEEVSAAADLVMAFGDLDEWLTRGGFLPTAWKAGAR